MRRTRLPLTVIAAILVIAVAAAAGGSLWALRRIHDQMAHSVATRSVLERGRLVIGRLSTQPIVMSERGEDRDWSQFSSQVKALHAIESGIQYVSVMKDGVTVFHEQTTGLDGSDASQNQGQGASNDVSMSLKRLGVGSSGVPVVAFTRRFSGDDGKERVVEIALKRDAVSREEQTAMGSLASMFRLSLLTVIASFALCVALVVWMMRREMQREKQRREEEHLAFAGVLANGIVHDFRNPMSSLKLDAQMLAKEAAKGAESRNERMVELSERMRITADRMDKVFQEFLYMSKPPPDQLERINLLVCVRSCVEMLKPRFEQRRIKVDITQSGEGVEALAYEAAVRRALMNVITNAEQFSPEGGIVTVRVEQEGDEAVVEITDQGPGVAHGQHERIFDMFVTSRPGGTGLGLFLAKTAVERCNGRISVSNAPGGGACFRISLRVSGKREIAKS